MCIDCPPETGKQIKEIEAIVEEDLEKIEGEDMISYYPNPVKEELYLKWELNKSKMALGQKLVQILNKKINI